MDKYEYIQLGFDWGDLGKLNRLADIGWRVVHVERLRSGSGGPLIALLERRI